MQKRKKIGEIDKKKFDQMKSENGSVECKSECKKKNKLLVLIKNNKKSDILSSTDDKLFF